MTAAGGLRETSRRAHVGAAALGLSVAWTACAAAQTAKPGAEAFAYDADAPLDVQVESSRAERGVSIYDLSYLSPGGGRVPAFLYVPEQAGPHAGLLMLHGLPGSRDVMHPLGHAYARRGAVVLSISAPFARPDGPRPDPVTFTQRDREEQIQLIQDLRRGVDLLTQREDVDRDRLGYLGGSYGGAMGGLLAGVEDRLKAYSLFLGDGGLVAHFSGPEDSPPVTEERFARWKEWMDPIEPIRFVGQAAPAELLFQQGKSDRMVPPGDAEAYIAAASEPKTVFWYDHGHSLSIELGRDQAEWLSERLGLQQLD